MCVCWSPDGRYIVTGGQDDLVSIWSLEDSMLVARCQGHNSWVTAVAFDPWRCDERNYRIGSVGEDCRLLLWDFSVGMLHRPRAASVRQRGSVTSATFKIQRTRTDGSTSRLRSNSNLTSASLAREDIIHPVEPRACTAMLPPVMAKRVDEHPLCWLGFEENCIITSCNSGHLRTWDRPRRAQGAMMEHFRQRLRAPVRAQGRAMRRLELYPVLFPLIGHDSTFWNWVKTSFDPVFSESHA